MELVRGALRHEFSNPEQRLEDSGPAGAAFSFANAVRIDSTKKFDSNAVNFLQSSPATSSSKRQQQYRHQRPNENNNNNSSDNNDDDDHLQRPCVLQAGGTQRSKRRRNAVCGAYGGVKGARKSSMVSAALVREALTFLLPRVLPKLTPSFRIINTHISKHRDETISGVLH